MMTLRHEKKKARSSIEYGANPYAFFQRLVFVCFFLSLSLSPSIFFSVPFLSTKKKMSIWYFKYRETGPVELSDFWKAIRDVDIDAVRRTMEIGADPTETIDGGWPLHWATYSGHTGICALLLDRGDYVDATDRWGQTPLHWASIYGQTEVCVMLIERGANLHARSTRGETPLHLATQNRIMGMCDLLLSYGADARAEDDCGKRANVCAADCADTASRRMDLLLLVAAEDDVEEEKNFMSQVSLAVYESEPILTRYSQGFASEEQRRRFRRTVAAELGKKRIREDDE